MGRYLPRNHGGQRHRTDDHELQQRQQRTRTRVTVRIFLCAGERKEAVGVTCYAAVQAPTDTHKSFENPMSCSASQALPPYNRIADTADFKANTPAYCKCDVHT